MNKEIVLNKKKCVINSIIIPIIFCLFYVLIYKLIPGIKVYIDENLGKQFIKGSFVFASIITLVLSMITFWGNEFFSEIRYKKHQMVLDKKKTELISMLMPGIFGIIMILFISFLPLGTANTLLFIGQLKLSIIISILVSVLSSIIIFWLIVLLSKDVEIK